MDASYRQKNSIVIQSVFVSHWPHNLKCENPIARERLILRQLYFFFFSFFVSSKEKWFTKVVLSKMPHKYVPSCRFLLHLLQSCNCKNLPDLESIWMIRKIVFIPVISLIYRLFCCSPLSLLIKGNNYLQCTGTIPYRDKKHPCVFPQVAVLIILVCTLHNVHFGKYVYLPTEQAETYLKRCVLIDYSTYICLCLFGWKVNMILKETVTFKL